MSNCPPEVFANVMGAAAIKCQQCEAEFHDYGNDTFHPVLCLKCVAYAIRPQPPAAVADDFATIARRLKELEAERSKPADASVSFRVADYLTDESGEWIPADGFSLQIIDLLADANEVFKNMVWTKPFRVLDADGSE